ncbi:lipoprotein [Spiroplasma phoeniceum]|uniref:Lipoprotein n=1 Tax=Spiroplasma phoeniceum P40 TaxID=1276259 RepID=A0A345DRA4_9MOLU|nr:lipoprotein [Spiroplasma phoeniceum]AXF96745.1 hypothetical protein SDAV_001794 [Spiroplasma phoeniceum P40]
MKKLLSFFGTIIMFTTPSILTISCIYPEHYYIPTQDATLQPVVGKFLTHFMLQPINDEDEYWVKHQDDNTIFTMFSKEREAHTLWPIINYNFNNPSNVPAFELPTTNVLFKTYIASMPTHLPTANQLYRDFILFPLIPNTTEYTYTTGQTTMEEYTLDGSHFPTTIYYLTINLNSNVFWSYELNKDLQEYLINYIQNHPRFIFKQNMTTAEIVKLWLTNVYSDSNNFKISNIKTIENIDELYCYLKNKITFHFDQLDTSKVNQNGKFNFKVTDQNSNYMWEINELKYQIQN